MRKKDRLIHITYEKVTVAEAVYLMSHHDGDCWCDGDMQEVILVE